MLNPFALKKVWDSKDEFTGNHPEFFSLVRKTFAGDIEVGTEIELVVKKPGKEAEAVHMKLDRSDLKFIANVKKAL